MHGHKGTWVATEALYFCASTTLKTTLTLGMTLALGLVNHGRDQTISTLQYVVRLNQHRISFEFDPT